MRRGWLRCACRQRQREASVVGWSLRIEFVVVLAEVPCEKLSASGTGRLPAAFRIDFGAAVWLLPATPPKMGDDIVSCLCSSLAGLVGAVHDAVAQAEGLSAPNDVLASSQREGGTGSGAGGSAAEGGGFSATHIAALLLLLAFFLSAFRSEPRRRRASKKGVVGVKRGRALRDWRLDSRSPDVSSPPFVFVDVALCRANTVPSREDFAQLRRRRRL